MELTFSSDAVARNTKLRSDVPAKKGINISCDQVDLIHSFPLPFLLHPNCTSSLRV